MMMPICTGSISADSLMPLAPCSLISVARLRLAAQKEHISMSVEDLNSHHYRKKDTMAESPSAAIHSAIVRLPMRDGIELLGTLYAPAGSGPLPTLVRMTPYDHARGSADDQFYAASGYAVLIVSFRGRLGSGGIFYESRNQGWHEHQDGCDTIEWAAAQPWSTGEIGTFGISSDGQAQLDAAVTRPPHLRAMFVSYAADYRLSVIERGVYTHTLLGWHAMTAMFSRPLATSSDWQHWLDDWHDKPLPLLISFLHPEVLDVFLHPSYDDYWRDLDLASHYAEIDVPIYYECGWYDRYISPTFQHFTGIRSQGRTSATRQAQRLIMGPWTHGGQVVPSTETVTFGSAAALDRRQLHLRWFDYWLKHQQTGILQEPPVRIYVTGTECWLEGDQWPLGGTPSLIYYLRSGSNQPGHSLNDGILSKEMPEEDTADTYLHDPYHPLPTIGGHGGTGWVWPTGPLDQRPVEKQSLTFTTDVLIEDLVVVGEVITRFFASSSVVDTDFVLTLTDVYPNGYSALLRRNVVRARYRQDEEKEVWLVPGEVSEFTVPLDAIAHAFKAGHRLRLAVASSSFPNFLPNPGTAEPLYVATQAVVAQNTLYHDRRYPSTLLLPLWEQAR
jgi:putative CocE/NonD family hydrolase